MISFLLNDTQVSSNLASGSTVLDYVRYHKALKGTKIGCREGDCGACTILVGEFESGKLVYRSMTSCLMPLGNAHGKHIVTVEGIKLQQLSPVQKMLVEHNGTQCGFCTIGFVMSLTGFVMDGSSSTTEQAIMAMDGNICRCTGYKSIERAAKELSVQLSAKPREDTLPWLIEQGYLPEYFSQINAKLQTLKAGQAKTIASKASNSRRLGGGTDLLVQNPELIRKETISHLFDSPELKGIKIDRKSCTIGASTTVTEFGDSPHIQPLFPNLASYLKLVSSTPIRNMATLGGNIINASPIGDMSIFFLGLDSSLLVSNKEVKREIKLQDFFLAYKKLAKEEEEHIESILFDLPKSGTLFNFEKVSKRTHLDIASVNSACQLLLAPDGSISSIHLAAGGVAPIPKYLQETCAFLTGKILSAEILNSAIEVIQEEVSPISDARGTEAYKRLLLRQLFLAHFLKFWGPVESIQKVLAL